MMTRTRSNVAGYALLAGLVFLLAAGAAIAQKKKLVKERVEDLESKVEDLDKTLKDVTGAEDPDMIRQRQEEIQRKLDDLAAELDDLRSQAEDEQSIDEERDSRIDAMSDEVAALWNEMDAQKELVEEAAARKNAGYDGGFFVQSDDGKNRLEINGFIRPYYRVGFQKTYDTDIYGRLIHDENYQVIGGDTEVTDNDFGLASARLVLSGQLFGWARGKVSIDYGTLRGEVQYPVNANMPKGADYNQIAFDEQTLRFMDAYAEAAPIPEIAVRVGQFKVPFDRETLFSTGALTFGSRSLMTRRYARWGEAGIPEDALTYHWDYETVRASSFGRDRGFQLGGEIADSAFGYAVGLFNGGGPNATNDNRDVLVAARLHTDFLGAMTPGMSDVETTTEPLVSIGAAFAYDLPQHCDPVDPALVYNSEEYSVTGDVHLKWYGLSLLAAVFYRYADHGAVFPDPIASMGINGQLAYYNQHTGLEPAFRYSFYDADIDRELDHVHEFTGSLGYHVLKQMGYGDHLRISLEYRGLFPAQKDQTYFVPWKVWYDYRHELTIMGQVSF